MRMKGWGSHDSSCLSGSSEGGREDDGDDVHGSSSQQVVDFKSMNAQIRLFAVSVDVRSFKANLHLPIASANVVVRVVLPPELVRLVTSSCNNAAGATNITTPLLTHPPIHISKGTEVFIPNGYLALELPVCARSMADMLTQQPVVTAQLLHRDKYAVDITLGVASVPMKQLIKHPIVEGYAPVIRKANGSGSKLDEVKIGSLHVILAIKELGSVRGLKTSKLKDANVYPAFVNQFAMEEQHDHKYNSLNVKNCRGHNTKQKNIDSSSSNLEDEDVVSEASFATRDHECVSKMKKMKNKPLKQPTPSCMDDENIHCSLSSGDPEDKDNSRCPKYELAWEFELWRQAEESKWRASLKAQENARMKAIEEKWKKREKDFVIEMCNTQAEQASLESKLRAKLLKLEKRERAISLAEEDMSKRKESLEQDFVNQSSDAQVALKRLHAECEHRIKLECNKYVTLQEQNAMLEQQLVISNDSMVNLEKQFVAFRTAQQGTVEAELVAEVIALEQHCKDLQRKGVSAIESRNDYKTQVLKMGKELANLHHQLSDALSKCQSQEHKTAELNPHVATRLAPIEDQAETTKYDAKLQTQQNLTDPMHIQQDYMCIPQDSFKCEDKKGVGAVLKLQVGTHELQHPTNHQKDPQEFKGNATSSSSPVLGLQEPFANARPKERIVEAHPPSPVMDVVNIPSPSNVKTPTPKATTTTNKKEKEALLERIQRQGLISMVEDKREKATILERIRQLRDSLVDGARKEEEDHQHSILYKNKSGLQEAAQATSTMRQGMVTHLMQQRADLLKMGVYNENDRLIKGLDRKIQQFVNLGIKCSNGLPV